MSLWYDKDKKAYASNGQGSWVKLYAEYLFNLLKDEILSKFANHYSGNEGKHQAECITFDNETSVKDKIDELNQEILNDHQNFTSLLSQKVDKENGMGLSQNSFSNAEKAKLSGIEVGAEVNAVDSVAGKTGTVTLTKADVGLENADNTADINKPVSNAVKNALKLKENAPTLIDLTEHNLTTDELLAGDYLDNCFGNAYTIKYGVTRIEGPIDYSEYNYATLKVKSEYSNIDFHDIRCLQELTLSSTDNNAQRTGDNYIQHRYTRIYSDFEGDFRWSDWKKDISYQEIICDENLLSAKAFNNYFSMGGQLEKYVIKQSGSDCVKGALTVFCTGIGVDSSLDYEPRFYTQILEIYNNPDQWASSFDVSRYVRTYGKYVDDADGTPHFTTGWSDWVLEKQSVFTSAGNTALTLVDGKEYHLSDITNLSISFPNGNFECWLSISFADEGAVSLTFPDDASYIGYAPLPSNGEKWEISVKNGVVVGAKVGDGNE